MPLPRAGMLVAAVVLALYAIVAAVVLAAPYQDPFNVVARLLPLWGSLSLGIAAILTPFLREIMKVFGKPFLQVHHTFAAVGLLLPTLHPGVLFNTLFALAVAAFVLKRWQKMQKKMVSG